MKVLVTYSLLSFAAALDVCRSTHRAVNNCATDGSEAGLLVFTLVSCQSVLALRVCPISGAQVDDHRGLEGLA